MYRMITIDNLEKSVNDFNKKSITFSNTDQNYIRIDTPFFDRHNDAIILYASEVEGNVRLTDAGYILDDLESDGMFITRSRKRMTILKEQLKSYSVKFNEVTHELYVDANISDYPVKQNLLIQAMLFVNDMFMLSKERVSKLFVNDVAEFLTENDIRAYDGPNLIGISGMVLHYEFSIAGIRDIPDKLIRVLNTPHNEYYAKTVAMDVRQTVPVVKRKTDFYAFVNDEEAPVDDTIVNLFNSESITTVPFSKRNEFVKRLAE